MSSLAQSDLRSLFNSVPDAIFIHDADGQLIDVNDRVLALFCVSREEALGYAIAKEFSSSLNNMVDLERYWQKAWQGEAVKFDWIARRPHDGSCFDAELVLRRVTLSGQERLMVNVRDVSDRKAAEVALSASERRLRKLASNLPGMIYQCRLDTTGKFSFPYASAACEEIWGYTPAQICNDATQLLHDIHPDDIAAFTTAIEVSARELTPWQWEGRMTDRFGKLIWISASSRPERQPDGSILWDGLMLNVTARKLAEQRLQAQAERRELIHQLTTQIRNSLNIDTILKTAIDETKRLLNTDVCAFAWVDTALEPVRWTIVQECLSPGIQSALGTIGGDVVGPIETALMSQGPLIISNASDCEDPTHRHFLEVLNIRSELVTPVAIEGEQKGVVICAHHSEAHQWTEDELSLVQAVSDQLAIALSQAQLYARSRQQAADLSDAIAKLKDTQAQIIQSEKMSSLGQMVAGVAHEINNPVNFIYANLQHSRDYTTDLLNVVELYRQYASDIPDEAAEAIEALDLDFLEEDFFNLLDSMKTGAQRIREIVLSLRNFSRLDESDSKIANVQEGINSTLVMLSHQLHHTPVEIIKQFQPLPEIECYPGQLNQVFLNLLTNAIDALKEAENPQIHVSTATTPNSISVAIANNGPVIPNDIQKKIFDPFFTTKPVGEGTGMGLAIAHQIITQNHSGQLTFTSSSQKTEFVIELPLFLRPS